MNNEIRDNAHPLTVWLLQTGEPLHSDSGTPRPMRAMNLSNALVASGHRVVLWSSAFYHQEKRQRTRSFERIQISQHLEIRLIPSPGYARNIGPGRLWDHLVLSRELRRLLEKEMVPPDVAFVGFPPIETAAVMTRWLARRGVPTILDVKDMWPTLFLDPIPSPLKPLGRIALAPYYHFARRAMRDATGITAMTNRFLNWSYKFSGRAETGADRVVALTPSEDQSTPEAISEARAWWSSRGVETDASVLRVMFVGSFMSVFDFETVRIAAMECAARKLPIQFVICGDGYARNEMRSMFESLSNVVLPGWIDLPKIRALAERSQIALAPYRNIENYTLNLPNKILDSLSLGIPILSPLEGEVAALIEVHGVGMRYGERGGRDLVDCLQSLVERPELCKEMARKARNLFAETFSYEAVYGGFVKHLEKIARPNLTSQHKT